MEQSIFSAVAVARENRSKVMPAASRGCSIKGAVGTFDQTALPIVSRLIIRREVMQYFQGRGKLRGQHRHLKRRQQPQTENRTPKNRLHCETTIPGEDNAFQRGILCHSIHALRAGSKPGTTRPLAMEFANSPPREKTA